MRIITGFRHSSKPEWNKAISNLEASAERAGHLISVATLPTDDEWIARHEEIFLSLCWKYKLIFIEQALNESKDDLLWIDGDCLIQKPIDFDAALGGCDVAFTLRDIQDRGRTNEPQRDGLINSGVIFVRNNEAARRFMAGCREKLMLSLYDQEAFNVYLMGFSKMSSHGEIVQAGSARVRMLNCREYNNFYDDDTFNSATIQHFKGAVGRAKYKRMLGVTI